jgi:hypothetical protein
LADKGINTLFTKDSVYLFIAETGVEFAVGSRDSSGLYHIPLSSIFSDGFVGNIGSTTPDVDLLTLFHQRTGDTANDILREAVRTQLIVGVTLPRSCFSKKGRSKFKCLCDVCARAKSTRASFPCVRDRLLGLRPGDHMSADVLIMLNIPSRDGYSYVLLITDHATKMSWVYPLTTREAKDILGVLKTFVEDELPKLSSISIQTVAVS